MAMEKENYYYLYVFIVVLLTSFVSVNIVQEGLFNRGTSSGSFFNASDLEVSGGCPCDEIGKKMHGCRSSGFFVSNWSTGKLVENYTGVFDGDHVCIPPSVVKINSNGFRDKEYSPKKPKNGFMIIALGDSITFGYGLNLNETYHQILERKLNNTSPRRIQILNFGAIGINMQTKVKGLKQRGLKFGPDLVLLQYHRDDIYNGSRLNESKYKKLNEYIMEISRKKNITPEKIKDNKTLMMRLKLRAAEEGKKAYLASLDGRRDKLRRVNVKKYLKSLERLGEERKFKVMLFNLYHKEPKLKSFCKNSNKFHYIPVSNKWDEWVRKYGYRNLIIHKKEAHPSHFANKLLAEYLFQEIKPYILS